MVSLIQKLSLAISAAALIAGAGVAQAASPKLTGEAKLAKLLDGRVAGEPVNCINQSDQDDVQVIDKTALVYGSGRTIYVNRPRNARDLDSNDVLVTRLHTSQLCQIDAVTLHDRSSHMFSGFVTLEQFVPYRRTAP
jgi:hypothetical protein